MTLGDIAISSGDIMRRLHAVEQRLAQMDGARRLENAAVGKGGLRFYGGGSATFEDGGDVHLRGGALRTYDTAGQVTAIVGNLGAGRHGIAAVDPATGQLVELGTLAFGVRAASVATLEFTSSPTFVDLATVGPSVTTRIGSAGRAIVFVSAHISGSSTGSTASGGGALSVAVSGATTLDPNVEEIVIKAWSVGSTTTGAPNIDEQDRGAGFYLFENLNPGDNTFKAQYSRWGQNQASFWDRFIVVLPY